MQRSRETHLDLALTSFNDVDHLAEWTHKLGWDQRITQLTPGANDIRYDHFAFPELSVAHFCARQSMHCEFALPDGMIVFLICRERLPLVWCGRHVAPSLMGVVHSGRENDVMHPAGWDCYEFMITEDLVRRTELFPPEFFAHRTGRKRDVLPLTEPSTGRFLRTMDSFFRQARRAKDSRSTAVRRTRFSDFIIGGLQEVIDTGLAARDGYRPPNGKRSDLVKKGRELITANLMTDLSVDDVAQALEISNRTLHYAFKDVLGVSPYRYILTRKLHAVRRQLKSADVSVTEACTKYGFNTPSRFARQYARLFGELPSETRHGNGRRRSPPPDDHRRAHPVSRTAR